MGIVILIVAIYVAFQAGRKYGPYEAYKAERTLKAEVKTEAPKGDSFNEDAHLAVMRGASWLDKYHPGWVSRIYD